MKKQTKILYALTVALGISTAIAGIAAADADVEVKAYTPQAITKPQPLVAMPQPVYVHEEIKPQPVAQPEPKPELIYHSAVTEPAPQPVMAVPQPIYLTSPTPPPAQNVVQKADKRGCRKCNKCGCNRPQPMMVPAPAPMPCQTGGCMQPAPMPMPCPTGGCMEPAPIMVEEPVVAPAPCDAASGECNRVPPAEKDGSLFPGGECSNCAGGKKPATKPCDAASGECNHVPPADKDGSLFPGGECSNCAGGKKPVEEPLPEAQPCDCAEPVTEAPLVNYIPYTDTIYQSVQRDCCQMASLALDNVDFRIKEKFSEGLYSNRIGQYRFRIFGCRRMHKDARLNSGRILEKNINFHKAFENAVDSCYKVLSAPKDLCLQAVPSELPEYVLTAEITDYFMNICDEYDWDKAEKKGQRSGNSEITVTWRLMDLTKNVVYWKGETTGFAEVYDGEKDGEIKLIERAFADAASNLRAMTGFEDQLMQRVPDETISAQRYAIIEEERALNPIKCGYRKEYECTGSCPISGPDSDISQCLQTCGCADETCGQEVEPVKVSVASCYNEQGNFVESATCKMVDDKWIDTGDVKALDTLCITTADPCQQLTPETVYRMRSSIVQIESPKGKKGAGLLISDRYILTSADLVDYTDNTYKIKTIRNQEMSARAVRVNPGKNTALLMLDSSVEYTPLALNLNLPEVNRSGFLTLGLLDVKDFKDGEDYLENSAKIAGYRYTEDKGAEIMVDTFIQNVTVGGALFGQNCTVSGMAQSGVRTDDGLDVYIPTETALRSLGISICNYEYVAESPWQQTVYKPVSTQIKIIPQAPEVMAPKDRK